MIDAAGFRMVEFLTRADLAAHPVWADYQEPSDRSALLAACVNPDRLDSELARLRFCGGSFMFPVLQFDPLPSRPGLVVAVRYLGRGDFPDLEGYLLGDGVFGFFVGDAEFCLNRSLPGRAAIAARALADSLGMASADLFPLHYAGQAPGAAGSIREGVLEPFWPTQG